MSDDNNQTTDEEQPDLPPELLARVEEMDEDETLDFDSKQRQDEGWLRFYVECPDCEVPMAKTTVESETIEKDLAHSASSTVHRAVCPDCGKVASHIQVKRITADYGDIREAFGEITEDE
mgnify:CR=1 FL=1